MPNRTHDDKEGVLGYLVVLTLFFILFELSFFIQSNIAYLHDFTSAEGSINIPSTIIPGILFFTLVQLSLHALFCATTWFCTEQIAKCHVWCSKHKLLIAIIIWFLGILTILLWNQYLFPNSKYAHLLSLLTSEQYTVKILAVIFSIPTVAIFLTSISIFMKALITEKPMPFLIFIGAILLMSFTYYESTITSSTVTPSKQANIIIIGIDSLRTDFLSANDGAANTPFLDDVLANATVFTHAITPIARTFPSWVSILLGAYPRETGVRYNLADTSHTDLSRTLPAILKQHGYQTVFATDETRFSNIDQQFGFDTVITPPMGLNDFILGSLNDFPLSNLLVNTIAGKFLFPYSYANRAAVKTYQPDTFITSIAHVLKQNRHSPLFLAVHFCLPHFPYIWASLPAKRYSIRERYVQSLNRVDSQVSELAKALRQAGLLNNALVIYLSDHGEALELPGDRLTEAQNYVELKEKHIKPPKFYPPSVADEEMNQSAGHGTDVLSLSQYQTLLAFQFFGQKQFIGTVTEPVSLVELKQSIEALVQITNGTNSIAEAVRGNEIKMARKHIFIESDYSPASIRTIYPDIHKVLLEGLNLYRVDANSQRLTVKPSMGYKFIHSRQYADIYGDWILALYPQARHTMLPVLLNLTSGEWTTNMKSAFAVNSPQAEMMSALRSHYQEEVISHAPNLAFAKSFPEKRH